MNLKKESITIDKTFILVSLILNGLTGLPTLSFLFGMDIIQLFISNFFLVIVLSIIDTIWIGYAILNFALKRNLEKKELLNVFVFIPLFAISFIGQLGNSEAFSIIFGMIGKDLYNCYIILIHLYALYVIVKNIKKGA